MASVGALPAGAGGVAGAGVGSGSGASTASALVGGGRGDPITVKKEVRSPTASSRAGPRAPEVKQEERVPGPVVSPGGDHPLGSRIRLPGDVPAKIKKEKMKEERPKEEDEDD